VTERPGRVCGAAVVVLFVLAEHGCCVSLVDDQQSFESFEWVSARNPAHAAGLLLLSWAGARHDLSAAKRPAEPRRTEITPPTDPPRHSDACIGFAVRWVTRCCRLDRVRFDPRRARRAIVLL
jgi:hypothetical protein